MYCDQLLLTSSTWVCERNILDAVASNAFRIGVNPKSARSLDLLGVYFCAECGSSCMDNVKAYNLEKERHSEHTEHGGRHGRGGWDSECCRHFHGT